MEGSETHEITPAMERAASDAVASFAGLFLRRLQDDVGVSGVLEDDLTAVTVRDLNRILGEALEQFSS